MNFPEAINSGIRNAFVISGRASRSEYWWWIAFTILFLIVYNMIIAVLFGAAAITSEMQGAGLDEENMKGTMVIAMLSNYLFMIPALTVGIRRLHDVGRSGWWMAAFWGIDILIRLVAMPEAGLTILAVVNLALALVLLFWFVKRGTAGENRYGPDPLAQPA